MGTSDAVWASMKNMVLTARQRSSNTRLNGTRAPLQAPVYVSWSGLGTRPPIARARSCEKSPESGRGVATAASVSIIFSKFPIKLVSLLSGEAALLMKQTCILSSKDPSIKASSIARPADFYRVAVSTACFQPLEERQLVSPPSRLPLPLRDDMQKRS